MYSLLIHDNDILILDPEGAVVFTLDACIAGELTYALEILANLNNPE